MKSGSGCVHIVDDDEGMLSSLQLLFSAEHLPTAVYSSAEEFLNAADWLRPGCLILDLRMPGMGGERLIKILSSRYGSMPIIVLTAHGSIESAVSSVKSGVIEYLSKPYPSRKLIQVVQSALAQDRLIVEQNNKHKRLISKLESLTERERSVVDLLTEGKSSSDIAAALGIQRKTVDIYRSRILGKLEIGSTPELIREMLLLLANPNLPQGGDASPG